MKKQKESSWKLWRLLKVFYFIITIPLILTISWIVFYSQRIYRWNAYFSIQDYYSWILYSLFIIIWYIILTDLFRRIIDYINNWGFKGFISYYSILTKYLFHLIIIWWIVVSVLLGWSQKLKNECTTWNEAFNDYWVCTCDSWYVRKSWKCEITFEWKLKKSIPEGSYLREYKEIPWITWVYIWIYIKDYIFDNEMDTTKDSPYSSCPEEVQWQWISWEYHIFTYENWKITSDLIIPKESSIDSMQQKFSYMNTKLNNSIYFNWEKPKDESENYKIEISNLIYFNDYNWDWNKFEFTLINQSHSCWHNWYLISWYDFKSKKAIIYWIKWEYWDITYWWDNFIPNNNWEVKNWWECWDHWAEDLRRVFYKYNNSTQTYNYIRNESRICTEKDYK